MPSTILVSDAYGISRTRQRKGQALRVCHRDPQLVSNLNTYFCRDTALQGRVHIDGVMVAILINQSRERQYSAIDRNGQAFKTRLKNSWDEPVCGFFTEFECNEWSTAETRDESNSKKNVGPFIRGTLAEILG